METGTENEVAWRPSADIIADANLTRFMAAHGIADYDALLAKSDSDPEWFWDTVIRHFGIRFYKPYERIMDTSQGLPWTRWCVGGTTNIVLNCLDAHQDHGREAVVWEAEDGQIRTWTVGDLKAETARLAAGLASLGIGKGDVVALFMPMLPETVAAFFAIAKIGAIVQPLFSGFGADSVASRMNDAGAVAAVTVDTTRRRGKTVRMKEILDQAAARVPSLAHVICLRGAGVDAPSAPGRDHDWHALTRGRPDEAPTAEMPADSPFMIVFTSGTTGPAKGTVHTHCGFVTKLAADFGLSHDFKPGDRMLWMSDLGWLVGPMQLVVTALFGGTLVLAEGTPDYPDRGRLWRLVQDHRVTCLGVAPTIARAMMQHGTDAVDKFDFSGLRIAISSGELWDPQSWHWFMDHVCRRQVPILNVSGGTEIGWGILTNTVLQPHKPCGFSSPCLAMGATVAGADGRSMPVGDTGELALRLPSIGLSRGLWNDPERYLEAYWNRVPDMWVHGDWASRDGDGTWYLHGRSDDTIMVAGKRCGPSEVESLLLATGHVAEAAATGVFDALKGEAIACACVPKPGVHPDEGLVEALRKAVVQGLGPAFHPRFFVFVSELPKTRSMKVMRRVVRALYEGRDPGDLASLVNPESLDELRQRLADSAPAKSI